jgi:CO/xanthine dehydrogenase FAD-binding subunit
MFPSPFGYHDPISIDQTVTLLVKHGPEARLLAGGQSLVAAMNIGVAKPGVVIDLHRVAGLSGVAASDDSLAVGAMVRQAELGRSEDVRRACPLLAEAVGLVGNARVRARGTFGGSLAHADPYAELPAVALVLDTVMLAMSPRGMRPIPADAFFVGPLTTALKPDELLIAARIPLPRTGSGWAIEEIARRPGDFAIAGAAAAVTLRDDGTCAEARLATFGAGPSLSRATAVETLLAGEPLDERRIEEAIGALDGDSAATHEVHLLRVVSARALAKARDRALVAVGGGA